jgi:hypothetical protein
MDQGGKSVRREKMKQGVLQETEDAHLREEIEREGSGAAAE